MELAEFLLARIAEDEDAAKGVHRGTWTSRVALLPGDLYGHIVRQHPQRVLAECEAKRLLVRWHDTVDYAGGCAACGEPAPCHHLRYLALPYASHLDFDPDWSLETQNAARQSPCED